MATATQIRNGLEYGKRCTLVNPRTDYEGGAVYCGAVRGEGTAKDPVYGFAFRDGSNRNVAIGLFVPQSVMQIDGNRVTITDDAQTKLILNSEEFMISNPSVRKDNARLIKMLKGAGL